MSEHIGWFDGDEITQCQPCAKYVSENHDGYGDYHQCMFCGGSVRWCSMCGKDHHERGWNSCNGRYNPNGRSQCRHPACRAATRRIDNPRNVPMPQETDDNS